MIAKLLGKKYQFSLHTIYALFSPICAVMFNTCFIMIDTVHVYSVAMVIVCIMAYLMFFLHFSKMAGSADIAHLLQPVFIKAI